MNSRARWTGNGKKRRLPFCHAAGRIWFRHYKTGDSGEMRLNAAGSNPLRRILVLLCHLSFRSRRRSRQLRKSHFLISSGIPGLLQYEEASADYIRRQGIPFTGALARSLVRSFCGRIEDRGYFSMFYSNRNFIDTIWAMTCGNATHSGMPGTAKTSTAQTAVSGSSQIRAGYRVSGEMWIWTADLQTILL